LSDTATTDFFNKQQGRTTFNDIEREMEKITLYLKESYHELVQNVSWPTTAQLQESTIVVIVTALILASIIFVMDGLCGVVFKSIYGVF